jgi:hypothetical protein
MKKAMRAPLLHGGVVVAFESDNECTTTTAMMASWRQLELGAMFVLQNESFVLVCTLFLGRIGFLSQIALPQPSHHQKEGLDEGICTNSNVTPRSCVCVGWVGVEVASPWEGERATLAILVWPQTLACFFWDDSVFCILCCIPQSF